MTATMRATVGLSAAEIAEIEKLKNDGSPEAETLEALTGISLGPRSSAAQSVHALVAAGLTAIRERTEELGYARQAVIEAQHPDCVAWRRMTSRHRPFMTSGQADVA